MGQARWTPGERLHDVLDLAVAGRRRWDRVAAERGGRRVRFAELQGWSDELARELEPLVGAGDRVALLFDRTPAAWAAMLALSKLAASWVPLDTTFPGDRMAWIAADAGARLVLTTPALAGRVAGTGLIAHPVSEEAPPASGAEPFTPRETVDDTAYVIYTSGTTGKPKGVPIHHAAFCNFIRVAAECYGYTEHDRVYQGLTIAFDFSVEEIWVPLVAGACLVTPPDGIAMVGDDLAAFLAQQHITALCCVPTLLETVEAELPELRLVLVSGESCPQQLVRRWATVRRRMVNLYGPTETTVSATWTVLRADRPVTIGRALPTYRAFVLDPETGRPVPPGEQGELVVGGVGVSAGYLGRPELTARAFIPDPLGAPGEMAYRTGDLVRADECGDLHYLGRIDSQVKVRGYRIELDEIESVLLSADGVAQAAVTAVRRGGRPAELAGFYTVRPGAAVDRTALLDHLRSNLPAYMVPSSLERLDAIPMLPSQKVDRAGLPAPSAGPAQASVVGAVDARESAIALVLAEVLGVAEIDVTADLFTQLGLDSFTVARLCAGLRDGPLPGVTTRLVYANPTVRSLAAATSATGAPGADEVHERALPVPHHASRLAYVLTGAAQALVLLAGTVLVAVVLEVAFALMDVVEDWVEGYFASVAVTTFSLLVVALVPIVVKWVGVGRWTERTIPAWSPGYFRFWIVRAAVRLSPMRLLSGSPLYALYLRALGVRIGRHALVLTNDIPTCPDLVEIGADSVIAPGVHLDGYRVEAGRVLMGRVVIGSAAVVGQGAYLDINTAVGDGARLAHASALLDGQQVPAGRSWHGAPAVDAGAAPPISITGRVGSAVRVRYGLLQLALLLLLAGPLGLGLVVLAVKLDVFNAAQAAWMAVVLFLAGLLLTAVVPRLLTPLLRPDRDYPVYSRYWFVLRTAVGFANVPSLHELFGDSSAIVWFLRLIGVRFRRIEQTGSNFGTAQHFDLPGLCSVGGGTLISDNLVMPNAEFAAHSFRVRPITVGDGVFMGNGVIYPAGAAVGDDVLLATKVMVPLDGPTRSGIGLLGSPAFEVPRTVQRDAAYQAERTGERLRQNLAGKNRHNLVTALLFLAQQYVVAYVVIAGIGMGIRAGLLGLTLGLLAAAVAEIALLVLVDLPCRGFHRLQPLTCSLYDVRFWRHERYWKLTDPKLLKVFDGTPFKALAWRMLGVRVGRMLLDDGANMPERSMVRIGDHVTLGAGTVLHGHSLEDGVFKSDAIVVESEASIGPSGFVHYGAVVGRRAVVAPDAFVMKGEVVPERQVWEGNPAHPVG